jgi:hypothetical protein
MKTYKAYLNQSSEGETPVATIEANTYGQPLTIVRTAAGQFRITAPGAFNGPTFVNIGNYRHDRMDAHNWRLNAGRIDDDTIGLTQDAFIVDETVTGDGFTCFIEIRTH